MFGGTLAENILYLRGTNDLASDTELDAATAAVDLRPLVSLLGGYGAAVRLSSRRPGTLVVIAHRISSALRAGRVLVLDGASAQAGDHSSLLASSAMWTSRPQGEAESGVAVGMRVVP